MIRRRCIPDRGVAGQARFAALSTSPALRALRARRCICWICGLLGALRSGRLGADSCNVLLLRDTRTGDGLRVSAVWLLLLFPLSGERAVADNLVLRAGKVLKIESLACRDRVCVATVAGGKIEIRTADIVRVEPDEAVDPELTPAPEPVAGGAAEESAAGGLETLVAKAARRYGLPQSLVWAVARAESALDPAAESPKGAQGLMQLMPATARELGVRDAFDPAENIDAGARLLRQLLEKYEGRVGDALAAYNAGMGAVARHGGVPPFKETRQYVRQVVRDFEASGKTSPESRSETKR